jgi:Fe-S-cluster containining protein
MPKKKKKTRSGKGRRRSSKAEIATKMKRRTLGDKLQKIYNQVNLQTSCCRQCACCLVACPQMNYSEAVNILDHIWQTWSKEKKKNLIVKSIKYFFSNSVLKACPMLGKGKDGTYGCQVYDKRPLNCRMYGLWPADQYEKRVGDFMRATGLERNEIPLNKQCGQVKRVDSSEQLTSELIDSLYDRLDALDKNMGSFSDEDFKFKANKRTIHDWVLAKFFGEQKLELMSQFLLAAEKEEIDNFIEILSEQVEESL